jgi:hypothetical protein
MKLNVKKRNEVKLIGCTITNPILYMFFMVKFYSKWIPRQADVLVKNDQHLK